MNKQFSDLLQAEDKKFKEAENIPAKLFRIILMDMNILPGRWEALTNAYYQSSYSRVKKNKADIASDKNNFNRAMAEPNVTWRNFLKALFILAPKKIRFDVRLTWSNDITTIHSVEQVNPMKKLVETNKVTPPDEAPIAPVEPFLDADSQ